MKAEVDRQDQVSTADTERNSGPAETCAEADLTTRTRTKAEAAASSLMEAVVERGNLKPLAYQRVMANKGAANVDALQSPRSKLTCSNTGPRSRAVC